ncbi:hypothetical protein [Beijerinckia sp. L45]|nr:hypothetical protein [Beijerinckia sp. L45]
MRALVDAAINTVIVAGCALSAAIVSTGTGFVASILWQSEWL